MSADCPRRSMGPIPPGVRYCLERRLKERLKMKSTGTKLLLAVSLLAIGACAKKPPKELPPPPVDTSAQQAPPPTDGRALPGSQADFVASVLADRVFFATDSSDVDQPSQGTLQSQASWLPQNTHMPLTPARH